MPCFDIWFPQNCPNLHVFFGFGLEMCFTPQRCAIFRHLNLNVRTWCVLYILKCAFAPERRAHFDIPTSKSAPKNGVLCAFWLQNVLLATAACRFPATSNVLREWFALCIFGPENALCATTACNFSFLIWETRFSEPTFRPCWPRNHWKNTMLCNFPNIGAPVSDFFSFSLLFFSRVLLFSAFLSPYCRKFDF